MIPVEHCIFIGVTIEENIYFNPHKNPFPSCIAIVFTYISENATFVWNFIDIFIMAFSIGLTTHFKVLNCELGKANFAINVKVQNSYMNHIRSQSFQILIF